jgi:hypothetical protein
LVSTDMTAFTSISVRQKSERSHSRKISHQEDIVGQTDANKLVFTNAL